MPGFPSPPPQVSVVIPAFNEQGRVGSTVTGVCAVPGVSEIIVVDDGSSDATAEEAAQAGARVLRTRHRGKGTALRLGIAAAAGELVLALDADLGASAAEATALVEAVRAGQADVAIAVLRAPERRAGFGIALAAARVSLWLLTGRWWAAPLSGQRCMTANLARALPWARGFAAEVAATADAVALGARVIEVPTDFAHAPSGRTLAGFAHRGRQFAAVLAAFVPRAFYPISPAARPASLRRLILALGAWIAVIALGCVTHPWLLAMAALAALAVAAVTISLAANAWAGITRTNYRGRKIPAAAGLGFALLPLAAWAVSAARAEAQAGILAMTALGAMAMSVAGLADDLWGSRTVSGLAGHTKRLARGRITTGAVKAVVGMTAGLTIGWLLARPSLPATLLNAALIALSTNLVNLLDLRPGRALKGFLLLATIAVIGDSSTLYAVAPIGTAALAFAPLDLGGRAMMGDTGANALGLAAGIALAVALPLWGKLAAVIAMAAIHLYAECRSLSDLIARAPALRWLDGLGRASEDVR